VQLFVERAAMCLGEFSLTDAHAPAIANICRRLDGIPLAIEMAAGRVDVFGIAGLADVLDDLLGEQAPAREHLERMVALCRNRRSALRDIEPATGLPPKLPGSTRACAKNAVPGREVSHAAARPLPIHLAGSLPAQRKRSRSLDDPASALMAGKSYVQPLAWSAGVAHLRKGSTTP